MLPDGGGTSGATATAGDAGAGAGAGGAIGARTGGGGTVTGYGLASAQLARLKAAGLKVTVCVDQVAASGGYLMGAFVSFVRFVCFFVLSSPYVAL